MALPQALSCNLKNSSPSLPVWPCSHVGAAPQPDVESLWSVQRHQAASPVGAARMEAAEVGAAAEEGGLLPARAAIAVRQSDALRTPARKSRIVCRGGVSHGSDVHSRYRASPLQERLRPIGRRVHWYYIVWNTGTRIATGRQHQFITSDLPTPGRSRWICISSHTAHRRFRSAHIQSDPLALYSIEHWDPVAVSRFRRLRRTPAKQVALHAHAHAHAHMHMTCACTCMPPLTASRERAARAASCCPRARRRSTRQSRPRARRNRAPLPGSRCIPSTTAAPAAT